MRSKSGMFTARRLLFPFSVHRPYFESYAWTLELATRMNAALYLLTTTTCGQTSRDMIYNSLLEAQGYYLEHYQRDGILVNQKTSNLIMEGELGEEVITHLKNNPADIVILDTSFKPAKDDDLHEIIKESGGVIILTANRYHAAGSATNQFYDRLRHAELYKLPQKFFVSLGSDRSIFNYLREIFRKKNMG